MYISKNELVQNARLKVERLVLPFSVVGNATPASKTRSVDDPSILFLRLEGTGLDDITTASGCLDSGETITFTDAASDASGNINCVVKISNELVRKVLRASCMRRSTTQSEADDVYVVSLGDADGLTSAQKIALTIKGPALTSGTHDLCLDVEYIVES